LLLKYFSLEWQEIDKQGATTLIEAMKFIPGGMTETRGRKVKQFFSVRGQKYPYPDYAINGIWQKEFHEVPYFFSPYDIEEIEIVRSSAALLTGLSGLSGVIKLKTREYDSTETALQMEYGSYGTFHGHLSHGGRSGKFSYCGGKGFNRTDGPGGKHAAKRMLNANGRIRWDPMPSLSFKANFFHLNGRQELRKAEPPASQRFQDMLQSFDRIRTTLVNMKANYRPSSWASSELHIYYSGRKPVFLNEVN
jgi:outer membrane receptor protein involved in Fe transport